MKKNKVRKEKAVEKLSKHFLSAARNFKARYDMKLLKKLDAKGMFKHGTYTHSLHELAGMVQ